MRVSKEYRAEAAQNTKPFVGALVIIALIYAVITAVINFSYTETTVIDGIEYTQSVAPLSFLAIFVAGQFALSWNYISQKVMLAQKPEVKDLFYGFKDYKRGFIANILMSIYLTLWGIITLGIAAIVKSYSYSMTYFLLEQDKSLTANEAITLSRRLMDGKKWKLFCLDLSYIGWHLLCALTFGILTLWVTPRVNEARYLFMKDVYEEAGYTLNCYSEEVF